MHFIAREGLSEVQIAKLKCQTINKASYFHDHSECEEIWCWFFGLHELRLLWCISSGINGNYNYVRSVGYRMKVDYWFLVINTIMSRLIQFSGFCPTSTASSKTFFIELEETDDCYLFKCTLFIRKLCSLLITQNGKHYKAIDVLRRTTTERSR